MYKYRFSFFKIQVDLKKYLDGASCHRAVKAYEFLSQAIQLEQKHKPLFVENNMVPGFNNFSSRAMMSTICFTKFISHYNVRIFLLAEITLRHFNNRTVK